MTGKFQESDEHAALKPPLNSKAYLTRPPLFRKKRDQWYARSQCCVFSLGKTNQIYILKKYTFVFFSGERRRSYRLGSSPIYGTLHMVTTLLCLRQWDGSYWGRPLLSPTVRKPTRHPAKLICVARRSRRRAIYI